jgi:hypothetical protein
LKTVPGALPETARICAGGIAWPVVYAKVKAAGEAERVEGGTTVSTTGTEIGLPLAPAAVMVTAPL